MKRALMLVAAVAMLVACGTDDEPDGAQAAAPQLDVDGMKATFTLEEFVKLAPVVVHGELTDTAEIEFTNEEKAEFSDGLDELSLTYEDMTFSVIEVLAGEASEVISVRRLSSGGAIKFEGGNFADDVELGQEYLLLLTPGEDVWSGGFLTIGPEAVATVDGDTVHFTLSSAVTSATGSVMSIESLRELVALPGG